MTTHHHFVAAILCQLGDTTPVLIYADWLEEQGDEECAWWRELAEALVGLKIAHEPRRRIYLPTEQCPATITRTATLPLSRLAPGVRRRLEEQAAFSEWLRASLAETMQVPLQGIVDQLCTENGLPNATVKLAHPDT